MPRLPKAPKPGADTPLDGLGELAPPEAQHPEAQPAPPAEPDQPAAAAKRASRSRSAAPSAADDFGFVPLDDTIDYLKLLAYGREGTAKTTGLALAANCIPKGSKGRILVINAEGGLKTVALKRRGVDTSRIVVWPDPKTDVKITSKTLERLHERIHASLMDDPDAWFCIGVDSITEIVQVLRQQATVKRVAKLTADPKVETSMIDEDFVDRDDYGVMTNQLREWLRDMRDLPCHVVFTALERVDDKTGMIGPAVTPALGTDLLGYVDIAMYHRATQHATGEDEDDSLAEFRALTRPGKVTRAKERFDLLPRVLAEPTFPRVLGYVRGELDEASDPIQAAYVQRREAEAAAAAEAAAEKEERKQAAKPAAKKATARRAAPAA